MKGLSEDDKSARRSMLTYNMESIAKLMKQSGYADPVGLLVDANDQYGKAIAQAVLEKAYGDGADSKFVEQCNNIDRIPTVMTVVTLEQAQELLAITSPTAKQNLATPRPKNVHFVVVIANGGNSYAAIHIPPDAPGKSVKDGQHRTHTQ